MANSGYKSGKVMEISFRGSRISIKLVLVNFWPFGKLHWNILHETTNFFDELPCNQNQKVIILSLTAERISLPFWLLIGIFKNVLPFENSFSIWGRGQHLGTFSTCMASLNCSCMSDCTEPSLWYLRECPIWLPRSPLHLLSDFMSLWSLSNT